MVEFDGSTFLPIADAAVGPDKPADTAFTHYIWNNIRYIERGYGKSAVAPLMPIDNPATAGHWSGKIYCGLREAYCKVIPIEFGSVYGVEKVTVDIYLHSRGEGFPDSIGYVDVIARLVCADFSATKKELVSGRNMVRLEIDIPLQERPSSGTLYLMLQGKDVNNQSAIASTTPIGKTFLVSSAAYTDNGPNSANWVGAAMTVNSTATSGPEHLYALTANGVATTGVSSTVITPGVDAFKFNLPRTEIASYSVSVDYHSEEYFEAESLRANIPEFADIARRFTAVQSTQFERPRLLSIGSQGVYRNDTGIWPDEFRSDWRFVDGDAAETELMRMSVDSIAQLGLLTIYPVISGVHLTEPPFDEAANVVNTHTLNSARTTVRWDITLKVEQYENGSATPNVVASRTGTFNVQHTPAAKLLETPFLQQAYYQWSDSVNHELTYKEGLLFEDDQGFFDIIQHTVQTGLEDLEDGIPFDIVLTAARNTDQPVSYGYTSVAGFNSKGDRLPPGHFSDPEYLRLFMLNHSVYFQRVEVEPPPPTEPTVWMDAATFDAIPIFIADTEIIV